MVCCMLQYCQYNVTSIAFNFFLNQNYMFKYFWGTFPYFLEPLMFSFALYLQRFRIKMLVPLVPFLHALFNHTYNRMDV